MNIEVNRLNTFTNWPATAAVDPIRIAKAGFFYTGRDTEVECFSCGGKISEWNYGDQVMWRHRTMKPNCAFVLNPQQSGNVPLVSGVDCIARPNRNRSESDNSQRETESPQDYGLTDEDEVYKNHVMRLLSFVSWEDTSVSREALVGAGFYHVGGGRIRCAWCGGELAPFSNMGSLGPPLEVHRMYFPRCPLPAQLDAERQNIDVFPLPSQTSNTPPMQNTENTSNKPQSSGAEHNSRVVAAGGEWRELGVVGGSARHPTKAGLAARLATYEGWPATRHQAPRALADAGFFYTGVDDQVRCFYCDGGLGKWEAEDAPWTEHAHWFPNCGYVLLVKGQEFIDTCKHRPTVQRTFSADRGLSARTRNQGVNFPFTESQVEECLSGAAAAAALGAGLDAARVRRAIVRRLRATGLPFTSSEALIDAVLNEQLNEVPWSANPQEFLSRRFPRVAEILGEIATSPGSRSSNTEYRSDSQTSESDSPVRSITPSDVPQNVSVKVDSVKDTGKVNSDTSTSDVGSSPVREKKQLTLEEENRQLKEARLCKVCMDNEVSVVFLPCGHLVACAGCGAALVACPLCRAAVRALVRAYLA